MTRRSATHLVDHDGLVGCTRRGHDVPVDVCLACPELHSVVGAADGITEIRCRPTPGGLHAPGPWALMGPGVWPERFAER